MPSPSTYHRGDAADDGGEDTGDGGYHAVDTTTDGGENLWETGSQS